MDFDDIPEPTEEIQNVVTNIQTESILPDPEPAEDALSEFNKKFNLLLEERRTKEAEVESAIKSKAAEDLSQWQVQRQTRLNSKKESNRSEEQVLLELLESEVEGGNPWERVTKLIDLSTESTDSKKSDNSRMKKLLIQLKNEPIKANN